jgi:hypothetical protein
MPTKLEKYLCEKRTDLDVETPDDSLIWEGVKRKLNHSAEKHSITRTRLIRVRNIAATIIILFSLGYITNDIINHNSDNSGLTLSSINSDLGHREMDYKTLINFKTREVRTFTASHNEVITGLFDELKNMDLLYDQSITDLKELGPNEKVIQMIFNIYEQKIRLLELIILESNKINSYENNEKINL